MTVFKNGQLSLSWLLFTLVGLASCGYWPYQTFQTVEFEPPVLDITTSGSKLAPGLIFFAQGTAEISNTTLPKQTAPFIMTDTGDLVWSGENGTFANNFKVDTLDGVPVLNYWAGIELAGTNVGHYYGAVYVLDSSYNQIYKICPKLNLRVPSVVTAECLLDGHESLLTDQGTLIFTVYNITNADLTSIGGPADGWVYDCQFYEIDIRTEEILFQWSALDHIPINATQNPRGNNGVNVTSPFDYFHINSVQPIEGGYLVNARHTWSFYMIDSTGAISWTVEGQTGGDFGPLPSGGNFRWQHDARMTNKDAKNPLIRMFNNYNAFQNNGTAPSNGLALQLSLKKRTATFISAFNDPSDEIYSTAQGNNQLLPNGNTLLYYGLEPVGKEFGPTGNTLWTARFGPDNTIQSYRMYKYKWQANPQTVPDVVVVNRTGYVSWNGATEVTKWAIYEGATRESMTRRKTVMKVGFETNFTVAAGACYVMVAAYDGMTPLKNSSVVIVD